MVLGRDKVPHPNKATTRILGLTNSLKPTTSSPSSVRYGSIIRRQRAGRRGSLNIFNLLIVNGGARAVLVRALGV
jgi:hypothetical protein